MAKQTEDSACVSDRWQKALHRIKTELSEQSYKAWFESLKLVESKNHTLYLSVPDRFYGDWIRDHYQDLIKSAWFALSGEKTSVEYIVREQEPKPQE